MARKVSVLLVDDMDGSDADETIKFGLDGTRYEIAVLSQGRDCHRAELGRSFKGDCRAEELPFDGDYG